MENLVYIDEKTGNKITDSLILARVFGKRHSAILRTIRKVCSGRDDMLMAPHFRNEVYASKANRDCPMSVMSLEGAVAVCDMLNDRMSELVKVQLRDAFASDNDNKDGSEKPESENNDEKECVSISNLCLKMSQALVEHESNIKAISDKINELAYAHEDLAKKVVGILDDKNLIAHKTSEFDANALPDPVRSEIKDAVVDFCEEYGVEYVSAWSYIWRALERDGYYLQPSKNMSKLQKAEKAGLLKLVVNAFKSLREFIRV